MNASMLNGIASMSATWNAFKATRSMNGTLTQLETAVSQCLHTDGVTLRSFVNTTRTAATVFEKASEPTRLAVVQRLHALGMTIADKMLTMEHADSASNVVLATMADACFTMGVEPGVASPGKFVPDGPAKTLLAMG